MKQANLDQKRMINFLTALYPKGDFINAMIERVHKHFSIDLDRAEKDTMTILNDQKKRDFIIFVNKKNPETDRIEPFTQLTENGIKMVWNNINSMYQTDPMNAFKKIKRWVKEGDQLAKKSYYTILYRELHEHIFDLYAILLIPHSQQEIIHNMANYYQIDMQSQKHMKKIIKTTMDLINRGMSIGLIKHETHEYQTIDEQGNQQNESDELFQLTKDGLEGVKYIRKVYMKGDLKPPTEEDMRVDTSDDEILHNLWDLPLKRIYVWVAVAFAITYFLGYAFPEFQSNALANGMLTYTKSILSFVGVFLFLVSFSEIFGRIKHFLEKQPKDKRSMYTIIIISITLLVFILIIYGVYANYHAVLTSINNGETIPPTNNSTAPAF